MRTILQRSSRALLLLLLAVGTGCTQSPVDTPDPDNPENPITPNTMPVKVYVRTSPEGAGTSRVTEDAKTSNSAETTAESYISIDLAKNGSFTLTAIESNPEYKFVNWHNDSHNLDLDAGVRVIPNLKAWTELKYTAIFRKVDSSTPSTPSTGGDDKKVGYLLYNSFNLYYDSALIDAFRAFGAEGVDAVVLDLRYNGGGHVVSSAVLGTLIAGPAHQGEIYTKTSYNEDRKNETVDTYRIGEASYNASNPKYYVYQPIASALDAAVSLPEVYVLCTSSTASASELVINGLRGIGIDVHLIGETTNGKNVGMEPKSATYGGYSYVFSPITFYSVNAQGFNDYSNGFAPDIEADDALWYGSGTVANGEFGNPELDEMLNVAVEWILKGSQPLAGSTRTTRSEQPAQTRLQIRKALPNLRHPQAMIRLTPESEAETRASDNAINEWMYSYMQTHYLWNSAVKRVIPNFQLDYESFLDDVLNKVAAQNDINHDDGHWVNGKRSYFYSNIQRSSSGRATASTRSGLTSQITGFGIEMLYYGSFSGSTRYFLTPGAVHPDGPAGQAGLKRGDIISKINGANITASNYATLWNNLMYGESGTMTLTIYNQNTGSETTTYTVRAATYADNPILLSKILTLSTIR